MLVIFIVLIILVILAYKYLAEALLFVCDFVFLAIASYAFLNSKIGNDSAIIATIIILIVYAGILFFINKKISILSKIINYIASFIGSFIGTQLFIYLITGILKVLGIFQKTYSLLEVTHIKFIDETINLILMIIVSIFVYKKRMSILNNNLDDDEIYEIINDGDDDNEDYKFYQEYYKQKKYQERIYNHKNEIENDIKIIKDYYKILGLDKTATQEEIKRAYYESMAKFHPDKNNNSINSNEITKLLNEAYEVLSDENKREQYDRFGTTL